MDEFYAFTDTRPDDEKWELIGGEPVLNAAPGDMHQWIVRNVVIALAVRERELNAPWAVLPGLGVRVSEKDRPEPDVLVILAITADRTGGATAMMSSLYLRSCCRRPKVGI